MKTILTISLITLMVFFTKGQDKHLFLLSGQSNMGNLDPSTSFKPIIRAAFPDDEVFFVKWAKGGNSIRNWIDKDENGELKTHRHFITLNKLAKEELTKNKVDKKELTTVTFLWMQGEADHDTTKVKSVNSTANYKIYLEALIAALEKEYAPVSFNVVIGRLNDARLKPGTDEWRVKNWSAIRKIQEEVASKHKSGAWIDTDDMNDEMALKRGANGKVAVDEQGNKLYEYQPGLIGYDVHGSDLGYKKMGIRFATEAIALISGQRPVIDEAAFVIRCKDGLDNYKGKYITPLIDPTYQTNNPEGSCSSKPVMLSDIFPATN
ncbi:sialate O-acetylesterase [Carboxylicivirga sp. RSCT41]|uniref:sialate O-acetylesterase n=1 Tax=Carboxylicivirga agarovorans TaxID=3417570 RepID=UPI003D352F3B